MNRGLSDSGPYDPAVPSNVKASRHRIQDFHFGLVGRLHPRSFSFWEGDQMYLSRGAVSVQDCTLGVKRTPDFEPRRAPAMSLSGSLDGYRETIDCRVLSAELRNAGSGYFFHARTRRTEVRPI